MIGLYYVGIQQNIITTPVHSTNRSMGKTKRVQKINHQEESLGKTHDHELANLIPSEQNISDAGLKFLAQCKKTMTIFL